MTYRVLWLTRPIEHNTASVFQPLFDDVKSILGRADMIGTDDALLFNGGTDINSKLYGEEPNGFTEPPDTQRDEFERMMFRRAQGAGAACIGICRGAQLLCALSGGKLIQHVTGHTNNSHEIITDDGRKMHAAADHHQMMYPHDVYHKLIAWSTGIADSYCEYGKEVPEKEPEIIMIPDTRSLCIQPHPEWMAYNSLFQDYCRELVKKYLLRE